ncbi:hypothetical protein P9112_008648 [Eukaryota sp. TZLM1-RC]
MCKIAFYNCTQCTFKSISCSITSSVLLFLLSFNPISVTAKAMSDLLQFFTTQSSKSILNVDECEATLSAFYSHYADFHEEKPPWSSLNFTVITEFIADPRLDDHPTIIHLLLSSLRIISRYHIHHSDFSHRSLETLVYMLKDSLNDLNDANIIILLGILTNLSLTASITELFLSLDVISPLQTLISNTISDDLLTSSCSLLQTLAYHDAGKHALLNLTSSLCSLLSTSSDLLKCSVLGVLHNITTLPESLPFIYESKVIPLLLSLLDPNPSNEVRSQLILLSSGTVQNIVRDSSCRQVVVDNKGVELLCNVAAYGDWEAQRGAIGALVNIFSCEGNGKSFKLVKELIGDLIVLGFFADNLG